MSYYFQILIKFYLQKSQNFKALIGNGIYFITGYRLAFSLSFMFLNLLFVNLFIFHSLAR